MAKLRFGILAAFFSFIIGTAGAATLFGTLGYGGGYAPWQGYCPTESTCYSTSYLVELNPATGAVIDYIGEVGYRVNGLAYDPSSGKLYGGTSGNDVTFMGLIEIDMTTGAGTPVGSGWDPDLVPITNITVNPSGQMYGWTERGDDLVSIDKAAGTATVVGNSGIGTGEYGLSFNSAGELYMVDYSGQAYRIDTSTGLASEEDVLSRYDYIHHGAFDWLTDLYYAISYSDSGSRDLHVCDFITWACDKVGAVGPLHTIAFENTLGTTQYALSIGKAGTGTGMVRSSPAGIKCGTDCSQSYYSGRVVTLFATADENSTFAGWTGDADCPDGAVTMDGAKSCTATFTLKPTHTLSVIKAGTGTGTVTSNIAGIDCGSDCSETYFEGTSVTLLAVPSSNSLFAGYSGDADCTDNTVTMDGDRNCTATFNLKPTYLLSVSKAGSGTGTVTSTPAGISCGSDCSESYMEGTSVSLSPVADASSVFAGWSGDADCSDASVTMTAARNCTATFNRVIAVTSPNGGDTLTVGTEYTISWAYTAAAEGTIVSIDLLKGGVVDKKITGKVSVGSGGIGSMTWTPHGKLGGSDYRIRITSKVNEVYTDTSDADFTIAARR